ncbi:dihydrofolate reductase family protein [Streptomyces sp. NPDC004609]|uniref:dihydrofolate reductase family protein n=1 Tax=Streptomyces sp. NPDC004609 TaxID=3364704 RepID=UPI00367946D2
MGTIKVQEFITLDGVIDAPTWTVDYGFTPEMAESIGGFTESCAAILLGRTTYEEFAPAWSSRSMADDPGAPFMNETPKYVVSSTLKDADWNNSTVLGGYDTDTIRRFKDSVDGGIYVSGSGTLVRALLADGLVDELHLVVYPEVHGTGPRLFPEGVPTSKLALTGSRTFDNGVLHLTYAPATD